MCVYVYFRVVSAPCGLGCFDGLPRHMHAQTTKFEVKLGNTRRLWAHLGRQGKFSGPGTGGARMFTL